tara:strand:- start:786 stop:1820 length:1035 start_codon:yes stop_codon:yes gene_type:complete
MNYHLKSLLSHIEKNKIGSLFHPDRDEITDSFSFVPNKPITSINEFVPSEGIWGLSDCGREFEVVFEVDKNLRLSIKELQEGEGIYEYLSIQLEDICEIGELVDFYNEPENEEIFNEFQWTRFPLDKIIKAIYLVLYDTAHDCYKLLELSPEILESKSNDIDKILAIEFGDIKNFDDELDLRKELEYNQWDQWLCSNLSQRTIHEFLLDPTERDFFYQGGILAPSSYKLDTCFSFAPAFAFRINPMISKMFLHDFFTYAEEADSLLESILKDWRDAKAQLKKKQIEMPAFYLHQIRSSLELRISKNSYKDKLLNLIEKRQPIQKAINRYQKLSEYMELIHKLPI